MTSRNKFDYDRMFQLSLYELNRTRQEAINDNSEILIHPRSLYNEFMCPICLDMLKNTMTTMECLHRFCSYCIIRALRSGNKECPTCRKKLISKRFLRPDPNFDFLISKIYPNRDEYDAIEEETLANLNKRQNLVHIINKTIQVKKKLKRGRKPKTENNSTPPVSSTIAIPLQYTTEQSVSQSFPPVSVEPVISASIHKRMNVSTASLAKNSLNVQQEIHLKAPSDTERSSTNPLQISTTEENQRMSCELFPNNEIHLTFKPHPTEMNSDNIFIKALRNNSVRYIKTTTNASVKHLKKYFTIHFTKDLNRNLSESIEIVKFRIYIALDNGKMFLLPGNQTLGQINSKFWKGKKLNDLEFFYSFRKRKMNKIDYI